MQQAHDRFDRIVNVSEVRAEADDISNLAFIGGKTNRIFSDKPPREYLTAMLSKIGLTGFDAQQIPMEEVLLETSAFKEFLDTRRHRIATRINTFINDQSI